MTPWFHEWATPRAYGAAMTLGAPAIELLLSRRAARGREDPARLGERRGEALAPRPPGPLVWLHAASVGESAAALSLIGRLLDAGPDRRALVTTGSVASARLMARRLPERALHQYAPVDRPAWARRFLDHWRPDLAIVMEADLWPAQLALAHARGVPILLANARLSERSFANWRRAGRFARPLFSILDLVMATNPRQAGRFEALGAPRVSAPGNLKRAAAPLPLDRAAAADLARAIGPRKVWLAASTHGGEEEAALAAQAALRERHPGLLAIVAPRHPERGPEVAALARDRGLSAARRAAGEPPGPDTEVYVADTFGEMALFFAAADAVFVAGSLVPVGGHNPVEPAHFDCAILFGPLMSKNAEIADEMADRGAAVRLDGAGALAPAVSALLEDDARRARLRENARRYAREGEAVLDAVLDGVAPFFHGPPGRAAP